MDAKAALDLVRRIGIFGLSGSDGCHCTSCEVQGVQIEMACRKSAGGIERIAPDFYGVKLRVHSRSLDTDGAAFHDIAREVASQISGDGYPVIVRFCESHYDKDCLCIWCEKPRADPGGYLCGKCADKPEAAGSDYRRYDFIIPATA